MHSFAPVSYTVTFTTSVTGMAVTADATGGVNCGGTCPTLTYDWDFGDGTAHGTGVAPGAHTYATAGSKSIKLTVSITSGIVGSATRSVSVVPTCSTVDFTATPTLLNVAVVPTVTCSGSPVITYDWNWGDGTTHGSANPDSHGYATAGTKSITMTASTNGVVVGTVARNVTVSTAPPPPAAPVAAGTCTWNANTWTMSCLDTTTGGKLPLQIVVDWGDGSTKSIGVGGGTLSHSYIRVPTLPDTSFPVTLRANDAAMRTSVTPVATASPAYFTSSGTVKNSAGTLNLASATVQLFKGTVIQKSALTNSSGVFTLGSLKPGTYTLKVVRSGYTFAVPAATITVGPDSTGTVINALTP